MNVKRKKIIYGLILLLALPALYLISFNLEFKKSDLKTIKGTLKLDPKFSPRSGKTGPCVILNLNECENQFNTEDFSYHVLKREKLKSQVGKGDTVYMSIKKGESISWVDKINRGFNIVRIMELWTDKEVYISIDDYNNYRKKDYRFMYVIWLMGVVGYLYWLKKNRISKR